jgi:cellulose synthase operon protein C
MASTKFMGVRKPAWVVVALLLASGTARADLASGKNKFLTGDYKGALADLGAVGGGDKPAAQLMLGRVHLRVGNYADAEKVARELQKAKDAAVVNDATVLLAEVLRATGRAAEARKELEPLVARFPDPKKADHMRARWQLALTLRDLGQGKAANKIFDQLGDLYNSIDQDDPEKLFYAAEGFRATEDFEDANGTYRDAVDIDARYLDANIEWGFLFLGKWNVADAESCFDDVLKIDPNHPDAHIGMARVKIEAAYDLAAAGFHIEQALAANPRHVPAFLVRATLAIDRNQWDSARAALTEALKINPQSLEAHSLLATVHWLRDDQKAYDAEKTLVLGINPEYGEFFHTVGRSAVREHRYKEAIELEKQAVAIAPNYWDAMEAIGTGLLRLGSEKEGIEWLEKAWAGDQYNMRTKNTLDLYVEDPGERSSTGIIPKHYSFLPSKHFKLRYPNTEKEVLHRYIAPLLDRAFEDMVARYGYKPATPLTLELYNEAEHYSVRTVGLPNLGALGVCFGSVITALSPSVGDVNWGMVVWHELAHVFAIQISKSKVPRWYTEGLSEYETLIARPEWRRENDVDVWAAMAEGRLPSVAELNYNFMKPDAQEVVVAYHLSSVVIEFIAQTWGFPRIVEGLHLFGAGKETPEVIQKITGLSVKDFDAKFRQYLEVRLAPYKGSFRLPQTGLDDVKKLEIAAAAAPKDPMSWARLALGHFYDGNAPAAQDVATKTLALEPKNTIALYVLAELALRARDLDTAKKRYRELIGAGGDGFDVRARLGTIAKHEHDTATAEKQFCAAKKLDPERSYPYAELAEMYEAAGRNDDALRELETYVMIEQMQLAPLEKLIDGYSRKSNWAKVRTYGELAVLINPFSPELHIKLGTAYLETAAYDKAIFELDSALMTDPKPRRPALAHIALARAYQAKNDKAKAIASVKKALEFEAANAEALALRKALTGK